MTPHLRGLLTLILVTAIWGTTFALVKDATASLSAGSIVTWRFLIAGLLVLPFLRAPRSTWRDGSWLGALMFVGYATQALGLETTTANRSAFITGTNVVLVPIFLHFVQKIQAARAPHRSGPTAKPKRLGLHIWLAALAATAGIALISAEGGPLTRGDFWTMLCAVSYAVYIIEASKRSARHHFLSLAGVQVVTMIACALVWTGVESTYLDSTQLWPQGSQSSTWWSLLYLGSVATAGTVVMQTFGQRDVDAAQAAVIYALEPVFAVVFSYLWLGESVGPRGWIGGALVVAATLISQYSPPGARKKANSVDLRVGD